MQGLQTLRAVQVVQGLQSLRAVQVVQSLQSLRAVQVLRPAMARGGALRRHVNGNFEAKHADGKLELCVGVEERGHQGHLCRRPLPL